MTEGHRILAVLGQTADQETVVCNDGQFLNNRLRARYVYDIWVVCISLPQADRKLLFSLSVFITNKWNKRQQNPHNLWICSKIEKTYQPTITVFGPFNTLWASQMSHSDQNCISINILGHVRLLHRSVVVFFFRAPYILYNTKPPSQFTIRPL